MLHLKHLRLEMTRARMMCHCPTHGKPSLSPRVIPHSTMPVGILLLKTMTPVKKMTAMKTVTRRRISLSTDSVLEPSVFVL